MTRTEALTQIDAIRETLTHKDSENAQLVGTIRDLWDNYPIEDARRVVKQMVLNDYTAEEQIKKIVAAIAE